MTQPRFHIVGNLLTHTHAPRFSMIFRPLPDGGWEGGDCKWPDGDEGLRADKVARLIREAGDAFAATTRRDWIRDAVVTRADTLGLTAYEIAKRTGEAVNADTVRAYFTGLKSMSSGRLQHVLDVLGLKIY